MSQTTRYPPLSEKILKEAQERIGEDEVWASTHWLYREPEFIAVGNNLQKLWEVYCEELENILSCEECDELRGQCECDEFTPDWQEGAEVHEDCFYANLRIVKNLNVT